MTAAGDRLSMMLSSMSVPSSKRNGEKAAAAAAVRDRFLSSYQPPCDTILSMFHTMTALLAQQSISFMGREDIQHIKLKQNRNMQYTQ